MTDSTTLARRRNGLPSGHRVAGPLPKRLLLNRWLWVFVVFTLLYGVALWAQYVEVTTPMKVEGGEVPGLNWSAVRDAAKLAWPTLLFWVVAFALLDRFRPQRPLFWWLALGWGGSIATGASLVINTWAAQQMNIGGNGQDPATGARAAIFLAPFVEEATKGSVLFLIAVAYRYRLVSRVTGIVLGGLSGAGFAFTENVIYYARAIVYSSIQIDTGDPEAAVHRLVLLRGVFTAFGHPLFTMITGIGVLTAVRTRSKVVRVLAPVAGYCTAALLHMLFNTGATFITDSQQQLVVYFAMIVPALVGVVIWVLRQLLVESRRLRARLEDYVRLGWLTEADAYFFSRERSRVRLAVLALSRGWKCLGATLALQRTLTELAYLRDAQTRGVVDAGGDVRARELLDRVAELRPVALTDPRGLRIQWPDVRGLVARLPRPTLGRRRTVPQLQPVPAAVANGAPLGSPGYAPVDPRWGPPRP